MKTFDNLKSNFPVNWTTILVGWEGLGMISPWPDKWETFPPLLTFEEVCEFCYDRIAKPDDMKKQRLILNVLEFENKPVERALVRYLIKPLSDLEHGDTIFELRKWRVIMLGEVLEKLKNDTVYDLVALSEFWQSFGFQSDSPMEFQGVGNNIRPEDYYTDENMKQSVITNREWLQREMENIKQT